MVVVAENPRRELPHGPVNSGVGPSMSRVTSCVVPWMVRLATPLRPPAVVYDPFGLEFDGRVLFNVKEIRAFKIFVPRLAPGIDRADVDGGRYLRLRNVFLV